MNNIGFQSEVERHLHSWKLATKTGEDIISGLKPRVFIEKD